MLRGLVPLAPSFEKLIVEPKGKIKFYQSDLTCRLQRDFSCQYNFRDPADKSTTNECDYHYHPDGLSNTSSGGMFKDIVQAGNTYLRNEVISRNLCGLMN